MPAVSAGPHAARSRSLGAGLAADKSLALFGRAYARDLVDVAALVSRLGAARVIELASAKDDGFSTAVFARALEVAADRPDEEFHRLGLDEAALAELRGWARAWADEI
jgi:hypothetical protein